MKNNLFYIFIRFIRETFISLKDSCTINLAAPMKINWNEDWNGESREIGFLIRDINLKKIKWKYTN